MKNKTVSVRDFQKLFTILKTYERHGTFAKKHNYSQLVITLSKVWRGNLEFICDKKIV